MNLHDLMPAAVGTAILCTRVACQVQPARQPAYPVAVSGAGNRVTFRPRDSATLFEVVVD
jgi:hypothetical protein